MKRTNGSGSVYKIKGNRRKPWIARITVSREDGKQERKYVGTFATKREALEALKTPQHLVINKNLQVADVFDAWSKEKFTRVSDSSRQHYTLAYTTISQYHEWKIQDIRTGHIQRHIDTLHENGYSYSYIHKIRTLWNQLFKWAVMNDVAEKNYASFAELPKKEKESKTIFSMMDLRKLRENDHIPNVDVIIILCYTGLRIGELLNLTVHSIKDGGIYGGSKTEAGRNRYIPILPGIQPYIDKRVQQSKSGYLIENEKGQKMSYDHAQSQWRKIKEELSMPKKYTFHTARHTFATLCTLHGINTKAAQNILGHADYSTTANIYTHLNDKKFLQEEMKKIKVQ